MSRKAKNPIVVQILSEGQKLERSLESKDLHQRADQLASQMPTRPTDRTIYIRNLTYQALRGQLDKEVFTLFATKTNTLTELETILPRAILITQKEKDGRGPRNKYSSTPGCTNRL